MDAQTGIQNLVYSLGEGWGRAAMRIFIASTCLLLVFLLYAAHQFGGLRDAKSMEFAQLAQNLADGRGFVTHCLRPVDLGVLARA
ncbi:MAG: hypothetical protein O3B24_05880, partial [Verrucomicrobia bacterium]|nr:hypothetical protein [Verrucomicrobiota bacterium]